MTNQIDTDAKELIQTKYGYGQQHIISLNDGTLYAVHINDSDNIEIHTSDDNGSTWILNETFIVDYPYYLCLTKSENDDIFLSYVEKNSSPYNIKIKRLKSGSGEDWTEIFSYSESTESTNEYRPTALITYNRAINRLHVFWTDNDSGNIIKNQYSTDDGDNWSSVNNYNEGTSGNYTMKLFGIDTHPSTGYVYLYHQVLSLFDPRTEIFDENGTRIGYEADQSSYDSHGGTLVIDSNGDRWQIFIADGNKLYVIKNDESLSKKWDGDIYDGMITAGIDGNDYLYIFFTAETDDKCYLYKKTYTWGSIPLAFTNNDGLRPSCEQHSRANSDKLNVVFFTN